MNKLAFVTEILSERLDEGSNNTAFHLAKSFLGTLAEFQVYTLFPEKVNSFPCRQLPHNKLLLGYDFLQQLRQFAPDYILYLPASSGTLGAFVRAAVLNFLSKNAKTGLINLQPRPASPWLWAISKMKIVDVVFAASNQSLGNFSALGFSTCQISVGVDTKKFSPVNSQKKKELRHKYKLPESSQIILHVGHLQSGRNIQGLVSAQEQERLVVLVSSGRYPADARLKSQLMDAGITVISEYIQNIEELYQLADLYLFPVIEETSAIEIPLSVLEAMACNLPVVTTPFGALPRIFTEGNGMFYFRTRQEMQNALTQAAQLRQCQTRSQVERYSWDETSRRIWERMRQVQN